MWVECVAVEVRKVLVGIGTLLMLPHGVIMK